MMMHRVTLFLTACLLLALGDGAVRSRASAQTHPSREEHGHFEGLVPPGPDDWVGSLGVVAGELVLAGAFHEIGETHAPWVATWNGSTFTGIAPAGLAGSAPSTFHRGEFIFAPPGAGTDTLLWRWDGASWSRLPGPPGGGVTTLLSDGESLVAWASRRTPDRRRYAETLFRRTSGEWVELLTLGEAEYLHDLRVGSAGQMLLLGQFDSLRVGSASVLRYSNDGWTDVPEGGPSYPTDAAWWHGQWLVTGERWSEFGRTTYEVWALTTGGWSLLVEPARVEFRNLVSLEDRLFVQASEVDRAESSRMMELTDAGLVDRGELAYGRSSGALSAMTRWQGDLYVAGSFAHLGGVGARNLARWRGDRFEALIEGNEIDDEVKHLARFGNGLAVSGDLRAVGNETCGGVAIFDHGSWLPIPERPPLEIASLREYRGQLVAAGRPDHGDATPDSTVFAWSGSRWEELGVGSTSGSISELVNWNGELVAVGGFTQAGGQSARRVAAWNGSSWRPLANGVGGFAACAENYYGQLIVAGRFSRAGSVPAGSIAGCDGERWYALGSGLSQEADGTIEDLAVFGELLIAAGSFESIGGVESRGIAAWDGASWRRFAQGEPDGIQPIRIRWVFPEGQFLWGFGSFLVGRRTSTSVIARYDGREWRLVATSSALRTGISLADGSVYLAGENYSRLTERPSYLLEWIGDLESTSERASRIRLDAIGPIPARGYLDVRYTLTEPLAVRYGVYDASGRRIVGVESGVQVAGPHILAIDAESLGLPIILSGVYFLRIEAGSDAINQRVVVIR
ncbi:MAG: T9SS type A sorting domain-containing protein [Candidatus Eisenbacteria bacterium]